MTARAAPAAATDLGMVYQFAALAGGPIFAAHLAGLAVSRDGGRTWRDAYASLNLAEPLPTLAVAAAPGPKPLVLADKEHYSQELFAAVRQQGAFDLLCGLPAHASCVKRCKQIPATDFTEHFPGYATATRPYRFKEHPDCADYLYYELVQRSGVKKKDFSFQSFLQTSRRCEVQTLTKDYPKRWHVEEFFKFNQALGWHRAGTLNLNVRYGQLTMALLAQAAISQLRQRLGNPFDGWDAAHLARNLFTGLEGDIRVRNDTILVTFYNAPNAQQLRSHYENLPDKLRQQGVDPRIPWLYNFQLDFRFK
jgi:hypothetical protein